MLKRCAVWPITCYVKLSQPISAIVHLLLPCVWVLAALAASGSEREHEFSGGFDAGWHNPHRHGYCELLQRLDAYGEARFTARAGEQTVFELQAKRDWQAGSSLQVVSDAPAWHPQAPRTAAIGQLHRVPGGGAFTRGDTAQRMLAALREGLQLTLRAPSEFDQQADVSLHLSPARFTAAFDRFLSCVRNHVQVSWQRMSRTRIEFAVDEHQLDQSARSALEAVAAYIREEPAIATIFVDGHTDASGDVMSNYQLSKRRASEVANFIKQQGLSGRDFVVRYHGARFPVADNNTPRGAARNRRVTVRLQLADPLAVAGQ